MEVMRDKADNCVIICSTRNARSQFTEHSVGIGAPQVVALDENLIAATDTHHLVTQIVVADRGARRTHGENRNDRDGDQARLPAVEIWH